MDPDRLLEGLDPAQRRAVTTDGAPLAILAGAGSGKTRVLTRRIAYRCLTGTAEANHVLALTFTRKAAAELDSRLRAFGLRDLPAAGTFHAIAYAQLRTKWAAAGQAAPTLLDRKGRVLGKVMGTRGRFSAADLAAEIEWAKARLHSPDAYPRAVARADRRVGVDPNQIAEWYRRYEQEKRSRGLVDFDDLLAQCAAAIETDPSFAAAQRWRFRHLFVDEYQDLNPLQDRLLQAWLGGRTDLAVVGDPRQAIYGWNGADPQFLVGFADRHPDAEVVTLRDSYRSTPQVLAVAEAVLAPAGAAGEPLIAHRGDGPLPTISGFETDLDEAHGIARAIHDHRQPGRPWSAQAVLIRTNAQAAVIQAALRRAAIPHKVRGAGDLLDQPDIKRLLSGLDRRREPLASVLADLEASVAEDRAELTVDGSIDADDDVEDAGPTDERLAAGRRVAALEQIVRLGRDLLLVDPNARTEGFSGWLRATLADDGPEGRDAVSILSFHAAKGLEWPVVHIAGVEAGLVPITHARTEEARAEERRLLYVAITRAQEVVRCTWAATRTFGAQEFPRKPSPYLGPLREAIAGLAAQRGDAEDPDDGLTRSRLALNGGDPAPAHAGSEADLRRALHAWRAEVARQAAVRPTVVLSDKGLETVVRRRPMSDAELADVPDVGPGTRERHGARLLAIVAAHGDA